MSTARINNIGENRAQRFFLEIARRLYDLGMPSTLNRGPWCKGKEAAPLTTLATKRPGQSEEEKVKDFWCEALYTNDCSVAIFDLSPRITQTTPASFSEIARRANATNVLINCPPTP